MTATAMKTSKTNGVLLRNRQIHGEFTVILSSENITKASSESTVVLGAVVLHIYGENKVHVLKFHEVVFGRQYCHGMWPSLSNPFTCCAVQVDARAAAAPQIWRIRLRRSVTTCPSADVCASSHPRRRRRHWRRHRRPVPVTRSLPDVGRTPSSAGELVPACFSEPRGYHGHLTTTRDSLIDGMTSWSLPSLPINTRSVQ